MQKRKNTDTSDLIQENDARSCSSAQLMRVIHRTMLVCPLLGLAREFEDMCVHAQIRWILPELHAAHANLLKKTLPPIPNLNPGHEDMMTDECLYTWKAQNSRLVTVIKTGPTTTVLWDHVSNTCFKAAPCCSLGPGCPVGSAFLGQVVMDLVGKSLHGDMDGGGQDEEPDGTKNGDWRTNVLIFDILRHGMDRNFLVHHHTAQQRYSLLRQLGEDSVQAVFVSRYMKVQWAGRLDALVDFREREGQSLPHIIGCYVQLGRMSPCELGLMHCM